MALHHDALLAAGARIVGIDIDSPARHAAMIEKLDLPFPLLSDPDRTLVIGPLGLSDPSDHRSLARPALILVDPDRRERWRFVSRDFADRLPEDLILAQAEALGLEAATGWQVEPGRPEPGPSAMSVEALVPYFRGARFAALAMGLRHGRQTESIKDDSKAYVAQMDRFGEAMVELARTRRP